MHENAHLLIVHYGAPGLFVLLMLGIIGLPIPDETLLTAAGFLIRQGDLNPVATFIAALAGSICGITISFVLGRTLGLPALRRWGRLVHVTEARLEHFHRWYERAGRWTLVFGYFVPGFRHIAAFAAGVSGLSWPVFLTFAYSGAVLWVSTFVAAGYFLAERWRNASATAHRGILIALGVLLMAGVAYGVFRWIRRRACRTVK